MCFMKTGAHWLRNEGLFVILIEMYKNALILQPVTSFPRNLHNK